MRLRLWRMDTEGKIAVGNLGLTAIAILVVLLITTLSDGHPGPTASMFRVVGVFALAVLSFPVGWLGVLFGTCAPLGGFALIIFIPLNAYLWGYVAASIQRSSNARKAAKLKRTSGDSTGQC